MEVEAAKKTAYLIRVTKYHFSVKGKLGRYRPAGLRQFRPVCAFYLFSYNQEMRSGPARIIVALLLVFLAGGTLLQGASLAYFAYTPFKPQSAQEEVIIEIRKGQNSRELARLLVTNGVISGGDERNLLWLGKISRQWKKIKAGEYKVSPAMTPIEIFGVITSGISVAHPVTVREGENMYEIGADLESKGLAPKVRFVELCRNQKMIAALGFQTPTPPSLEGYLFPDTYFFNKTMSVEEIIRSMVKRFHSAWGEKEEARAKLLGFSRHQAVTLASMVEKETGAPQERPMISSVFHNRLRKKMRLQSDPTTIYGIWENYKGNIRRSDLVAVNPYNTYSIPALPVGPIANPGSEAIQAALYPATSDYLFFVSHNDGTHEFTRSFEEHNRAVQRFQLDPSAREGKSWRDLKK